VLGHGNADSYVGLLLSFIPHHPPVLVLFDEEGQEQEQIDMAPFSFEALKDLMEQHGFRKKQLL